MLYKVLSLVVFAVVLHLASARNTRRHRIRCGSDEFFCNVSQTCVPEDWRCDHYLDCEQGEDEQNCSQRPRCEYDDDFQCGDGECIPADWRCDFDNDCPDGSDEGHQCDYANMVQQTENDANSDSSEEQDNDDDDSALLHGHGARHHGGRHP